MNQMIIKKLLKFIIILRKKDIHQIKLSTKEITVQCLLHFIPKQLKATKMGLIIEPLI